MAPALLFAHLLALGVAHGEPFAARIEFGLGENPPERWRGTIRADGAKITSLSGWLFTVEDRIELNAFDIRTRQSARSETSPKGLALRGTTVPGGRVEVSTDRGAFHFRLDQPTGGRDSEFLGGTVRVSVMPTAERLTDDSRYDDYPSVSVGRDGAAWLVWQSYSGGRDEIRIRKFDGAWRTFSPVPGVSGDVWRPQVALDAESRPWVVWSQQVGGNFDIYARSLDEGSQRWGPLFRLSDDPGPDLDHHLVADSRGWLWIVWQGFRGDDSDIFLRHFDGSRWSGEVTVTAHPANDWQPRVAVDRQGLAAVVWDSYRGDSYDVFLRTYRAGRLGPVTAVAETERFEAHASAAIDLEGRVWVAWDEGAPHWGKDSGPTTDPNWIARGRELWDTWIDQPSSPGARLYESRRINLRVLDGTRRMVPAAELGPALAAAGVPDHDTPQLAVDPLSGRVAILFKRWNHIRWTDSLGFRPVYWEHAVVFYEGDRWSPVHTMPESWGRISGLGDAEFGPDGSLTVVWTTDGRLEERPVRHVRANVLTGRPLPAGAPSAASLVPASSAGGPRPEPIHPSEARDVAAVRSYRTAIGGAEHRIARGDLHRHTEFSWDSSGGMVDGSLFDFYRYALDAAALDFGAVTDHNAGGDSEYWWWLTGKSADLYHVAGAFVPLFGYERSAEYPDGHRNILHARRGVPVVPFHTLPAFRGPRPLVAAARGTLLANDTRLLHESLRRTGGISIPHTPGSVMGTDWRVSAPDVEPVVEVFQGDRVSYEHPGAPRAPRSADDRPIGGYREDGFLWSAYRKGLQLGVIASSDHWSTHISYAMVFTEAMTRQGVLSGIKKRRTYGATDNIILEYRMGPHFMGDRFTAATVPPLNILAIGTAPIASMEVIRNETVVYVARPGRREATVAYLDSEPPDGDIYYYVRVRQDDGEIAWGSPIWIRRPGADPTPAR